MIINQTIKKIVAGAMFIVFAFSITPTIFFHNWLADHTDSVNKSANTNGQQLGKKLFNCHCDNLVAESPFTEPLKENIVSLEKRYSSLKVERQINLSSSTQIFHSLRGPPAV